MSQPPIRILCLHGYTQSGPLFSNKTGALRKALTSSLAPRPVEFHYPTGPLALRPEDIPGYEPPNTSTETSTNASTGLPASNPEVYGWWRRHPYPPPPSPDSTNGGTTYTGLDATLTLLSTAILTHGPFDGVLGFSQGACLAAMLCSLLDGQGQGGASTTGENGSSTSPSPNLSASPSASLGASFLHEDGGGLIQPPLKFAVLVSGFRAGGFEGVWKQKVGVRSLHVIGSLDVVVDEGRSRELADGFEGAEVVVHPGGHFVPSAKVWVGVVTGFVRRCLDEK